MESRNKSMLDEADIHEGIGISFGSELRVLAVVAHPDDETLWMGGTMLMHPDWNFRVVSLCRGGDRDRRPRFFRSMRRLGAMGSICGLDDGPDQHPVPYTLIKETILSELENINFDVIITHSPFGEYTRHLRHEEVGKAVLRLWREGELIAKELWMFAYTDSKKTHYPRAMDDAHLIVSLPKDIWERKQAVMQEVYGFVSDSWEAMTTPRNEAFWRFTKSAEALAWQRRIESGSRESIKSNLKKGDTDVSVNPL